MVKKLEWMNSDPSELTGKPAQEYAKYLKLRAVANEQRDRFDAAFIAAAQSAGVIPSGQRMVVSHRFEGKIGVAFDTEAGSAGSKKFSLKG